MIPPLNQSGVLPPFLPEHNPAILDATAPYLCSMIEIAERFTGNPERKQIFRGLLNFRADIRAAGLTDGFQWIDGSFLEDCEKMRGRPPHDVDLVTFANRPKEYSDPENWSRFITLNKKLFDRNIIKSECKCDSYFVDLTLPPRSLVLRTRYWFGLFSHQRETFLWKGLLQVDLLDDSEESARHFIEGGNNHAS